MSRGPRRIRLDLAYDGTDFEGWQLQSASRRTVQGVVEVALTRLAGGQPVRLRASGRTDSGVHALAQVADCVIDVALDDQDLAHALHCILPADVRPRRVTTVDDGFSARTGAWRKTYQYRLDLSRYGNPLLARYAYHVPHPLDREALDAALRLLPGERDWSGFAGSKCEKVNRVRNLMEARYQDDSPVEGRFTFAANGFLTYMVRNLVGTLIEIALGRRPPDCVARVLESGDRKQGGPTAPAHGLCLTEVLYAGETVSPYAVETKDVRDYYSPGRSPTQHVLPARSDG